MLEGHACSMTTEPRTPDDLAWRATGHAALSDVGRLRVIDSLEVADVSPRDLAAALGMSSNLLAHHLKVLESAGLVRRLPSESDGRRTYVRLVPEALARLGTFPTPALPDGRVVFVCSGNSARSQLAAAVWAQRTGRPAGSAGTRPAARIHPGTIRVARSHGLQLLADRPRTTGEVLRSDDVLITVCDSADREVDRRHSHWSIPDPVRVGTSAAFERTLADLTTRIDGWVEANESTR
jgi:protein-tyrosine-phosphatase/DNA-binding transcriptional ArsR family regulator